MTWELSAPFLVALSLLTAGVGALGGLGGGIFLVPILVLLGVDPRLAAPLGILTAAAGSLAAAPRHLDDGVVHHRLGITLETTASTGAIIGALVGGVIARSVLARLLALVAFAAAVVGLRGRALRNQPEPAFSDEVAGEWPGTLAGAYELEPGRVVPYQADHLPVGLTAMIGAGFVAGLSGVSGGFIKTPIMREIMHVPVRVAAATTTFTVGITSAASLLVYARQDRIDLDAGAAVVLGGLAGGFAGARLARRLPPTHLRMIVSGALAVIAVVLAVFG